MTFAQDFVARLKLRLERSEDINSLLDVPAGRAQHAIDLLDKALLSEQIKEHKNIIHRHLMKFARKSKKSPNSLVKTAIRFESMHPISGGGFADIFCADLDGVKVAVKRLRRFLTMSKSVCDANIEDFRYEVLLWRGLHHPHVLPLLDIHEFSPHDLGMVSPWVDQGNVRHVLDKLLNTMPSSTLIGWIFRWMHQSASGLQYLHGEGVIHGDLRGPNMLIDSNYKLMLTDFGLSVFSECTSHAYGSKRGGNPRWLAPELVNTPSELDKPQRPTKATDVFSLSRTYLELCTGKPPYPDFWSAHTVASFIRKRCINRDHKAPIKALTNSAGTSPAVAGASLVSFDNDAGMKANSHTGRFDTVTLKPVVQESEIIAARIAIDVAQGEAFTRNLTVGDKATRHGNDSEEKHDLSYSGPNTGDGSLVRVGVGRAPTLSGAREAAAAQALRVLYRDVPID
ncbi:hypothetical protein EIP91_008772 [Steccherinum ochraceum]|uniref:Protein kinase domain-containing protein n=1 Tax=Steccherinum ochraceum TaxID=92696 RepID=A0A4R0R2E7_9APHY|nr:hypothetical protein EIP91_008772 [Steccherinum ochraceum]